MRLVSRFQLLVRRVLCCFVASAGAFALLPAMAASTLVEDGQLLYTTAGSLGLSSSHNACSDCHFTGPPPRADGQGSNHPLSANFAQLIQDSFLPATPSNLGMGKGKMTQQFGTAGLDPPSTAQIDKFFKMALYIGQFKAPRFKTSSDATCTLENLSIKARVGVIATAAQDVYKCLAADGSGGVAQTSNGLIANPATVSAGSTVLGTQNGTSPAGGVSSLSYVLSYQSAANRAPGADSFELQVVNPTGSAVRTINVEVFGVTSPATATGIRNTVYNPGAPLYRVTSNDASASFGIAADSPTSLAALGLSINSASGEITGPLTAAPGSYTLRVQANISALAAGANAGPTTRDVLVTVHGITGATARSFNLGVSLVPANDFAASAVLTGPYAPSVLPAGLQLETVGQFGRITGTPSAAGIFPVTVSVPTVAGVLSQTFDITVGSGLTPVVSTNLPASPVIAASVGTSVNGSNYRINGSNGPVTSYSALAAAVAPGVGPGYLPPGLTFNADGTITGTPTESGDFDLILRADNGSVGTLAFKLRIRPIAAPVVGGSDPAPSAVNTNFPPYQIVASNGPITSYQLEASSLLPPGLSLDPASGVISGIATTSGVFTTSVRANNSLASGLATSAPKVLTFMIQASDKPGITSPTFVLVC